MTDAGHNHATRRGGAHRERRRGAHRAIPGRHRAASARGPGALALTGSVALVVAASGIWPAADPDPDPATASADGNPLAAGPESPAVAAPRSAVTTVTAVGMSLSDRLVATRRTLDTSIGVGAETSRAAAETVARVGLAQRFHPPLLEGWRTSDYGSRWGRMHHGVDYGADIGTPLYAVTHAVVEHAGWAPGLGWHVVLDLGDGTTLIYGHLSWMRVSTGETVLPGQQVGDVGNSGRSTGAHLHFEVRIEGDSVDPDPWLAERGAALP